MNNIMVDLETMGVGSDAAIVSIGAVKFDSHGLDKEFYRNISLESSMEAGLSLSGSTIMWWLRQEEGAREALWSGDVSLQDALARFWDFVGMDHDNTKIWGNGAPFDNVILRNAFTAISSDAPWKFWGDRCYRTMKSLYPDVTVLWEGTKHNALDDAKHQARHLIQICKTAGIELS